MFVIFIDEGQDEYNAAETDENVRSFEVSYEEVNSHKMTSDEYYAEMSEEEKEEVVNKEPIEEVTEEILELDKELTIDEDGEIVEEENFADIVDLGDKSDLISEGKA